MSFIFYTTIVNGHEHRYAKTDFATSYNNGHRHVITTLVDSGNMKIVFEEANDHIHETLA